jgi:methyl-accepting chemotaxis protein
MKIGLVATVSGIKGSTDSLSGAVHSTNEILNTLIDRITDTSAATEELSAATEEAGGVTEEMNATAAEIERAVENVAEKAEEGATRSGEIHNRASELGKTVTDSIERSNNVFNEIKASLEEALENSKAVAEINALADAILSITSQTTLLALNASIESARAGEAGRGFAVVANEISALADNSKNTVTEIQKITKVVMNAVNALAGSSTNLLNFVAGDVMNDYKGMLTAADSYSHDAVYMSDMTSDLSATSEELLASVQILLRAITDVAASAQEGARAATIIAEQTTDISLNTSTILENMKGTQNTSEQLTEMVNKFKL